jgi:hypothetical protein
LVAAYQPATLATITPAAQNLNVVGIGRAAERNRDDVIELKLN